MKKFFALFLLLCLVSCKQDDSAELPDFPLGTPVVIEAAETTALVSCQAEFDLGAFAGLTKGFLFGSLRASSEADFRSVTATEVDGRTFTCLLTGLTPGEQYNLYGFVGIGSARYMSGAALLETLPDTSVPKVEPTFGAPSHADVTANGATIRCSFAYTGAKPITAAYFLCESASGVELKSNVSATPGEKSATLTSLSPQTAYTYRFYVVIEGDLYASTAQSFTTAAEGGTAAGNTLFAGWAELPTSVEKPGDWYYTYHITDVNTAAGHKARNYAVCYSREKMCAVWVAAPMHPFYATKTVSRTDAYKDDPTLGFSQPGKWTGYTRGHLLGSAERLVSRTTNEQVFYYSNIAPQLQTYFNTGGGAWNTLEDWVDTQWSNSSDTTYQVIGAYWDPAKSPAVVAGTTVPTHYYKVLLRTKKHLDKWVVNCSRDELQCIAVMVEHREYAKSEVPKTSQYASKGMLYTVAELEKLTGVTFFGNVPNAPKDSYDVADWGF